MLFLYFNRYLRDDAVTLEKAFRELVPEERRKKNARTKLRSIGAGEQFRNQRFASVEFQLEGRGNLSFLIAGKCGNAGGSSETMRVQLVYQTRSIVSFDREWNISLGTGESRGDFWSIN